MKGIFLSCLMNWILNRKDEAVDALRNVFGMRYFQIPPAPFAKGGVIRLITKGEAICLALCIFLQTPVFKGEERDRLGEIKQLILTIVNSKVFFLLVIAIIIAIGIFIMYNRKKAIPELTVQVIQDDTWFTTRDDNNRVGIVVSVNLNNKSTRGVYITDCRLSGYSAKENPVEIVLKDVKDSEDGKKLNFPVHKNFCKGQEFYLGPFSSESLWFYYESRMITMRNVLETPLTIKDSEKRRKTLRLTIPRHADQRAIYEEMSKMW